MKRFHSVLQFIEIMMKVEEDILLCIDSFLFLPCSIM